MHRRLSGCLAAACVAVLFAGCGGGGKSGPAKPSHKSAEGAMAGLLAAMKTGDNAQVATWISPTPASDRTSISSSERLHNALGLGGKLFWEVDKLTVKDAKESGQTATVTLSGPIVWCFGDGPTDAKASCAQPDGASGQTPVYKAVKQGDQWYVDIDINKGKNLPNNPALAGSSGTSTTTTPSTTGGDADAKSKLQSLGTTFNSGQRRFLKQVIQDSKARNFQAIKADVSQFRDVIFNFDADARKIKFPPSLQTEVNKMLEGDRTIIAELDAMGASNGFVDFLPLFKRFQRDKGAAIASINALIAKL
jgi:hypothetical protein